MNSALTRGKHRNVQQLLPILFFSLLWVLSCCGLAPAAIGRAPTRTKSSAPVHSQRKVRPHPQQKQNTPVQAKLGAAHPQKKSAYRAQSKKSPTTTKNHSHLSVSGFRVQGSFRLRFGLFYGFQCFVATRLSLDLTLRMGKTVSKRNQESQKIPI